MSFFNNFQPDRFPGPIKGNPLNGLCEKVCIQANKVFDACIKQVTDEGVLLTVQNPIPANPTYPLTFISAKNISSEGVINNLTVTRLDERPKFARIQCSVAIPIEVIYVDAEGVEGKGVASITVPEDIILHVPEPSIIPYQIRAIAGTICPEGTYTTEMNFVSTACITVIIEVTVETQILVPCYGYCPIPPCQEFNQDVCATFFELPLYPANGE